MKNSEGQRYALLRTHRTLRRWQDVARRSHPPHRAGATTSLGIVTEGTAHLSTLPEEKERQSTLSSSTFGFEWSGKHLTLVDTPGDSNFQADGRIALCALDGAILLVSAVSGAKVGTQRMWQFCQSQEIPMLGVRQRNGQRAK